MSSSVPTDYLEEPWCIDALLQNCYLLVLDIQQGLPTRGIDELWQLCVDEVENARRSLAKTGFSPSDVDLISFALCALLDETLLVRAKESDHAQWAGEPLQARFFERHAAGASLYEDVRTLIHLPAPNLHVLTAFARVLRLGFKGRYTSEADPERQRLLAALEARLPLLDAGGVTTVVRVGKAPVWPWWSRSLGSLIAIGVLLITLWWGLDSLLAQRLHALREGIGAQLVDISHADKES